MATGDSYILTGQRKVTDAEAREHQATLLAKRITDIPNDLQIKVDPDGRSDNQPVYVGFAPKGLATSSEGWLLWKITYDSFGDFSYKQVAYDDYDSRASASYS